MKATGIVRRIDDLGRIVIPKELRRTLGIAEGDPIEIFTDSNMVCLKKYSDNELLDAAGHLKSLALMRDNSFIQKKAAELEEIIKGMNK